MAALSLSSNVPALTPFVYRSLDTLTLKRVSRMSPLILRSEIVSPVAMFRQRFDVPGSFSKAPCGVTRVFGGREARAMGQRSHALSASRIARMRSQKSARASRTTHKRSAVSAVARPSSLQGDKRWGRCRRLFAASANACAAAGFVLLHVM